MKRFIVRQKDCDVLLLAQVGLPGVGRHCDKSLNDFNRKHQQSVQSISRCFCAPRWQKIRPRYFSCSTFVNRGGRDGDVQVGMVYPSVTKRSNELI